MDRFPSEINDLLDCSLNTCLNDRIIFYSYITIFFFFFFAGLTENAHIECGIISECPHPCRCADGIVDCREKSITTVPLSLPDDTTEL